MSRLKQALKSTFPFIWKAVLRIKTNVNTKRVIALNKKYKKAIMELYREDFFNQQLYRIQNGESSKCYIIALQNPDLGIYGYLNYYLPHIAYALAKGYIPIIDMKNYHSVYQVDQENAWESFFQQPCGMRLNDSREEGYKVLYSPTDFWYSWLPSSQPIMSDQDTKMWANVYRSFIHYNERSLSYLQSEMKQVLAEPDKTVGVIYRGCAYTKGKAKGHPIQPSMKMLADKVQEVMTRNGCSYIYVASDEKSIVEYMNMRFPEQVLVNKRMYYDEVDGLDFTKYNEGDVVITADCFCRENNEYLIGIEYISSMNLVAHCKCLVAGACGGTTAVLYMNGGRFAEQFVFDLGRYGIDDLPKE